MFKFQYQNGKKRKSGKKFSGLQNGARFRNYKLGKESLQIGVASGISNRGKLITNEGRNFRSGKEEFQIGAGITEQFGA